MQPDAAEGFSRLLYILCFETREIRVLVVRTTTAKMTRGEENQSETVEMYLQTIYRLKETHGSARKSSLASSLGVSMGAVTNTLASLEKQGLVQRRAYRGVDLTPRGETVALRVLRRHRLAERLLTEVLGMKWAEVHEVACRLEHVITEDVVEALERLPKNPKPCPHGNPIPNRTGRIKQANTEPLTKLKPTQEGVLVRIVGERR